MKKRHSALIIMLLLLSFATSMAQEKLTEEDRDIAFQNHFFEALKQRAIQNYKRAVQSLELCHELDSTNVAVYYEFAKNHLALEQFFEAEYFIDKALELKPGSVAMLNHEVQIYKAQQKFDKAIATQQKLIEIDPKNTEELIVLYMQNRQYDKAEEQIAEIERKGLSSRKIATLKQFIINRRIPMGNENAVLEEREQTNDIPSLKNQFTNTADFSILTRLLELMLKAEQFEALNTQSDEGLELYPAQPQLYKYKAMALNALGKYNDAIDVLTIGIDFVVNNNSLKVTFYEIFEQAYIGLNNNEKATEYNEKAADLRNKIK